MNNGPVVVTTLGTRGSVPVSGREFSRYGGATFCVVIRSADGIVVLDAGTGLMKLSSCLREERNIPIFLTHGHADHLLGFPVCPEVLNSNYEMHVYGVSRDGCDACTQIGKLMSAPLWPIGSDQLPANIVFHEMGESIELNGILVECMEGCHPGGVTLYRVTAGGKKIVCLTDCTINEENRDRLLEFCRNCDLLLCDGQYSDDEWEKRAHFGHNTWSSAAQFGADCGAGAVRLLHHDPAHTDEVLERAEKYVKSICAVCSIAYDGEETEL